MPGRTLDQRLEHLLSAAGREEALAELAGRIAVGVVPLLAVVDPGLVVIGGPTGAAGGERLAELVRTAIRRTTRWSPDVVATAVAEHPVLRGARDRLVSEVRASLLDDVNSITA